MMRFSRLGAIVLLTATVLVGTNCSYYNRVMARKNLVDGSNAYKGRNFPEAEHMFREAVKLDPNGENLEGRTAQLFLARTLHSQFIGNRQDKAKAEEAIAEYRKALAQNPNDQSSYKAIASLLENLQRTDEWLDWVTKRANNTSIPGEQRAEALTSLAARKNSCANDISDTEQTKKTVTKDGKQVFQFVKPTNPADFTTLVQCVEEGTNLINQVTGLETDQVRNAQRLDPPAMSNEQLKSSVDHLKVFESARSYKASLLIQAMRVAEMDGRTEDRDRLKQEADAARAAFLSLSDIVKKLQKEIDDRAAAEAAKQPGAAPAATPAS